MGEDSGEKTEEPTPHKLREARKKGQIAKSKDITGAIMLFVSFYVFKSVAAFMWDRLRNILEFAYLQIPAEFSKQGIGHVGKEVLFLFLGVMAPIFVANFGAAILIEALQTGFLITFEPLQPSFSKLNPISGFKKFFSMKQYVELVKTILKMVIVIYIIFAAVRDETSFILQAQSLHLWMIMRTTGQIVVDVATRLGTFYLLIAIVDYFYQKQEFMKSMKMSKKEIKEEYKRLEGDPLIKQRQRDAARRMAMGRQMGSVPSADVVVTNPVHVACAIVYKQNEMKAPLLIAKGKRLVAEEIKRIAEEHHVPIIENPPVARTIFKRTPVGSYVPPDQYKVVAEILAFVYNLKKKRKRRY